MADEHILINRPNGHQFMGRKAATEVQGSILQQLACPTCGRRWESMIDYAIDLTGREV